MNVQTFGPAARQAWLAGLTCFFRTGILLNGCAPPSARAAKARPDQGPAAGFYERANQFSCI